MKSARVLVGLALLAAASGWPFGKPGGEVAPQQPGASASGAALAGLGEVSADELRQAQAMMNDPRFIEQMMSQLKDPKFMSQLKESLASPESRRMMEQMGMSVPTEEEIAAAMAKLESPEFQAQLRARAEQAAMAAGGKMSGSRLSHSKVDQSGQQQAVLGA